MHDSLTDRILYPMGEDCIVVATLPCPFCGRSELFGLTEAQVDRLLAGEPVHEVLAEFTAPEREQFISGIDGACWTWHFGDGTTDTL